LRAAEGSAVTAALPDSFRARRTYQIQPIRKTMHIGIAGNIGCGKTTLTRMLAEHYGWTPKFEAVTYNPYLEDYYKDIQRWSFNLETYFLTQRFKDVLEIANSEKVIVQDRTGLFLKACTFLSPTTGPWETSRNAISTPIWIFSD